MPAILKRISKRHKSGPTILERTSKENSTLKTITKIYKRGPAVLDPISPKRQKSTQRTELLIIVRVLARYGPDIVATALKKI